MFYVVLFSTVLPPTRTTRPLSRAQSIITEGVQKTELATVYNISHHCETDDCSTLSLIHKHKAVNSVIVKDT